MRIELDGGLVVVADSHCFKLRRETPAERGKVAVKNIGYYTNLAHLISDLAARDVRAAPELEDVRETLERVRAASHTRINICLDAVNELRRAAGETVEPEIDF